MLLDFARTMRAAPTDAEHRLWQHLRVWRLPAFKFRRQQPLGKYIVDFVCLEARLIVELDGGQHSESVSDIARDAWLRSQGFVVLRFWNNDVFENLAGVVERILVQLQQPHPSPQPLSGPRPRRRKGRGARSRVKVSALIKHGIANKSTSFASLPLDGGGTEGEGDVSTKLDPQNER